MNPICKLVGRAVLISGILVTTSCQMIGKPDTCDHEPLCELESGKDCEPVAMEIGDSRQILICACHPWNASGIKVFEGQQYAFKIDNISDWTDGTVKSDPIAGWEGRYYRVLGYMISPLKRSQAAPWYALVGVVSRDDKDPFAVIESQDGAVRMSRTGALFFYVNDMKGRYYNNNGTLSLRVTLLE